MKLSVGITHILPQWEIILRQIGLPCERVDTTRPLDSAATPVLIVSSKIEPRQRENILRYLNSRGTILTEANIAGETLNIPTKTLRIRYLVPAGEGVFSGIPLCDLPPGRRKVAAEAAFLKNQNGKYTAAIIEMGRGKAVILPSEFSSALLSHQTKRKNFPAAGGGRPPSERVAQVSKGSVRQIIQRALEHLYHFRGLPFAHLWHLPGEQQALFGFRIDSDFSSREEVQELYALCRKYGIRATWFVETKSAADWIKVYREMENQEIAYHCYRHRVFPGYRKNLEDFQSGLKILREANIHPEGYAAPFGEWHPVLGKVIEKTGFRYSSEFAAGYDDLPFYPYLKDSFSEVVQVPIHPVSVGRLRWARHSPEQIAGYYLREIEQKSLRHEPVFLYHHPGHRHWEVFEKIFQEVKARNIPTLSLGEYAEWWRQRSAICWAAEYDKREIKLDSNSAETSFRVRVEYPGGKSILLPLNGNKMEGKELAASSFNQHYQYDPAQLRKYNWHMLLTDIFWTYAKLKQ